MPDYMFLLESRLSPEQRAVLTRVQELSAAMGFNVYLTGGTVRDLVTGASLRDLDFTVEGIPRKSRGSWKKAEPKFLSKTKSFAISNCYLAATWKVAFPRRATIITFAPAHALKFAGPPSWKICAAAIFLSTPWPSP